MENGLIKLRKEIKEKRDALDFAIDNNSSREDVIKIGKQLDDIIAKYLKESEKDETQKNKYIGKYINIIETDYKDEIINMVKIDIKDILDYMIDEEQEHFCNNVYIYSVLKANNINEEEILKQIMYRNTIFLHDMEQRGIELTPSIPKLVEDYYIKLIDKYEKIIKKRM